MMTTNMNRWAVGAVGAAVMAVVAASCGSTGGGGDNQTPPSGGFVLNSNNSGQLTLTVSPNEVDANKSDRIGLVAKLTDRFGNPVRGIQIRFTSDIPDIRFIPATGGVLDAIGTAFTDTNGIADIIAVAGADPTGTGAIVGTGAIFAEPTQGFGLRAQQPVTLLDVGFIDAEQLGVIPTEVNLIEPAGGTVLFFNIVGGTPPYLLKNETDPLGAATLSQHCAPGCTGDAGSSVPGLCVGSPCQSDGDCNLNDSPTPANVCIAALSRCLASCGGTNCAGSRCQTDADCNDGSPTPANVCADSGQSIAYILTADPSSVSADGNNTATHLWVVEDSDAASVNVSVSVSFVCGNGVAGGNEQCDLDDVSNKVCASFGLPDGCDQAAVGAAFCATLGITTITTLTVDCNDCQLDLTCEGTGGGGGIGGTPTPSGTPDPNATPTPTSGAGGTPTPAGTPGPGIPSNLALALLSNGGGDNGNATLTTVIAATVTDSNGNPVPNGTAVGFAISGATAGAIINSPSTTNATPPCDVSAFESQTGVSVTSQPGVAHTCVTYPSTSVGSVINIVAASGAASDNQNFTLPVAAP
jgi:hypothetical protein